MSDEGSEAMRGRLFRLVIAEATYGDLLRQCRIRAPIMFRMAREAIGRDAAGLADRLGVSESHVGRIERGEDLPSYQTLEAVQRLWEAAVPRQSDDLVPPPTMALGETPRGFAVATFRDHNGEECSIQESSIATEDLIWLGVDQVGNKPGRMHLGREMAGKLWPLLKMFAETGGLGGKGDATP